MDIDKRKNDNVLTGGVKWYDVETKIAGTIDLVCSRNDGTYEIYDWKRSNKIDPTEALNMINTTSPSYPMLTTIEANINYYLKRNYSINNKHNKNELEVRKYCLIIMNIHYV